MFFVMWGKESSDVFVFSMWWFHHFLSFHEMKLFIWVVCFQVIWMDDVLLMGMILWWNCIYQLFERHFENSKCCFLCLMIFEIVVGHWIDLFLFDFVHFLGCFLIFWNKGMDWYFLLNDVFFLFFWRKNVIDKERKSIW